MTIDQLDALIKLREDESKALTDLLSFVRNQVREQNAIERMKEVAVELVQLRRQKSELMEAAA